MGDNRRLVYSTEHGSLGKPTQSRSAAGKNKRRQAIAPPAMNNPSKQGVRIRRESKGRGGKTVSVIDGLPLDESELKILLKQLKGSLGTGGAVKNGMLEIQGEHREKLVLLLEKIGYKARLAGG